jgi:aspartate carbamoyltransferase catalytic subunit
MMMPNNLFQKNIISISEFSRDDLELIVNTAKKLKTSPRNDLLKNKLIASCFFEASTRTRLSFETAIQRLGGRVIGFSDANSTSLAKKGETLADSLRIITSYADALVMRHHHEGAARLATDVSPVPIINAGDGSNQHPSQTILDLFTIYETQGSLEKLNVAFIGDLKYGRTVHSLAQALSLYNARLFLVSPESLAMPDYLLDELENKNIEYHICPTIESVIPEVDILYMTRVQKERFDETEYSHLRAKFILTPEILQKAKPNLKVLHPLPRIDEITIEVDQTPYAYYFQQAANGVYARQAILSLVLNEEV